jgi:hypothetical protein
LTISQFDWPITRENKKLKIFGISQKKRRFKVRMKKISSLETIRVKTLSKSYGINLKLVNIDDGIVF